jgi:orotidine-5'-phosphate decarboxylase
MSERNWNELLAAQQAKGLFVCVGLDVATGKIPGHFMPSSMAGASGVADLSTRLPRQLEYAKEIVRATVATGFVGCFKPNLAFWKGDQGKRDLRALIAFINELAPWIPVILDAKWGDIGNTNDGYVSDLGEFYGADAALQRDQPSTGGARSDVSPQQGASQLREISRSWTATSYLRNVSGWWQ